MELKIADVEVFTDVRTQATVFRVRFGFDDGTDAGKLVTYLGEFEDVTRAEHAHAAVVSALRSVRIELRNLSRCPQQPSGADAPSVTASAIEESPNVADSAASTTKEISA